MKRFLMPTMLIMLVSACASEAYVAAPVAAVIPAAPAQPYMAQVVGVQWLNPLQRRDYPTEWQLLWTLGLAKPNKDDSKVKENPVCFGKVQSIGMIASGNDGEESFVGFHEKYGACQIFCVKRGHEIIPKGKFHDRRNDYKKNKEAEGRISISG